MNPLIQWALGHRGLVLLMASVLIAIGSYVAVRMPVDVFPDLTAPTVTILVEGHGTSPKEMESRVTYPIEAAVNGATDVRRVRSATALGLSVVWVEFEWGTDIHRARQTVAERLATVMGSLPPEVEPPRLAPASSIMGEILFVSLTSPSHSQLELRSVAATQLRRRLLAVSGVSQVTLIGGDTKQYQVVLSPERLKAFAISPSEVAQALRESNENVAAGILVAGPMETIVEGLGRIRAPQDIGDAVVAFRNGAAIRVKSLGTVQIGAAFKRGIGSASRRGPNWEPITEAGVICAIQKQPGSNTLELTRRIELVLQEIQANLPRGMFLNTKLFRQASFIETSIRNTTIALIEGAIVVAIIVIAFLASLRASAITLITLPISLLASLLVLKLIGSTVNTMTLGGMAIAIGALVDDAIIDVENVVRRLRERRSQGIHAGSSALRIVFEASVEVRSSIVLATVIIVLAFAPIFLLPGVEGRLLEPLGLAFTVALSASLLTALTVTPVLCLLLLPKSRTVRTGAEPRVVHWLKIPYKPSLRWAMRHPRFVAASSILLLLGSAIAGGSMGRSFLPEFNEGALVVGIVTLPGTSLEQSDELAKLVEKALMRHPEIVAIGRRTGRAEEDEHVQGVEASEIDLTLDMEAPVRLGQRRRSKEDLLTALRAELAGIPGVQATFGQPISHRIDHMLSGTRASIAVKIFGEDLQTLRSLGSQVEAEMSKINGVVDLSTEQQAQVPSLDVELRRDALARHGARVSDAASALRLASGGDVVGQVLEGLHAYDLLVRVGTPKSQSPQSIQETLVELPEGRQLPLRYLASFEEGWSPNFISRENVQRKIVVMCNVSGRDMRSVVDDVRLAIERNVELPQGYYVEFGGQFESSERAATLLTLCGAAITLGILALLYFNFQSLRDALFILLNLPLALIGSVLGVYLTGGIFTVASMIGFITVFGIATRNGIMMVSHVRHLQLVQGVASFPEAVERGAVERLAPIMMTALAAGLALVPLALRGDEPGNEILSPMATVILCGLLSSTLLSVVVLPSLFCHFGESAPVPPASATLLEN
ncbi:MAG: efflux RND transporter permease subunit [Planctomycetes bacterium]|nr:efflux RND transporter permease subunit [Planctomycetota bacterium]